MPSDRENYEEFDYVVAIREGAKVCFGSAIPRNTSPIGSGLSPFQKRLTGEISKIAPGHYRIENITGAIYQQLHKIRSKAGVGGLASKAPRFKEKYIRTPSPGRYHVKPTWGECEKSKVPLGGTAKIRELKIDKHPGPGTYEIHKTRKCRRTRFMSNFGRPSMVHCVEMVCISKPIDRCLKCDTLCEGDYWHRDHSLYLCQLCWNEEKRTREIYSPEELKLFKKIRNCSFMHNHEETNAAIRILPQSKINKKIRLENYLDLYLECDIPLK